MAIQLTPMLHLQSLSDCSATDLNRQPQPLSMEMMFRTLMFGFVAIYMKVTRMLFAHTFRDVKFVSAGILSLLFLLSLHFADDFFNVHWTTFDFMIFERNWNQS